jgi:hypothetical protein
MHFRILNKFLEFLTQKRIEKSGNSTGPVFRPKALAQQKNSQPAHARGVRHDAVTMSRPRAWRRTRRGRNGGRNQSGSTRVTWRRLGDGAEKDEVSGSSPWCSVIGEAEEGFGAAMFGYGSDAPVPTDEL